MQIKVGIQVPLLVMQNPVDEKEVEYSHEVHVRDHHEKVQILLLLRRYAHTHTPSQEGWVFKAAFLTPNVVGPISPQLGIPVLRNVEKYLHITEFKSLFLMRIKMMLP